MIHSITVLAQVESASDVVQSVSTGPGGVVVVGFLFVIAVLTLLAAVTSAMGAWFSKQAARDAVKVAKAVAEGSSKTSSSTDARAQASPANDEDDPAIMAVVAAAVHSAMGDRPHRVVSIRSAGPGWAQEGRRQIFSSHRVR